MKLGDLRLIRDQEYLERVAIDTTWTGQVRVPGFSTRPRKAAATWSPVASHCGGSWRRPAPHYRGHSERVSAYLSPPPEPPTGPDQSGPLRQSPAPVKPLS